MPALARHAQRPLDIAICGAGPGGLAAALFLHRAGHRITVIERFERPRPVGSGLMLQPVGLAVLRALGLDREIHALGQRIERLYGRAAPSGRVVLDVRYPAGDRSRHGLAVHRAALFGVLYDAVAKTGVTLETATEVSGLASAAGDRPVLIGPRGRKLGPFDLVVDALGTWSPLHHAFGTTDRRRELPFGALWATVPWASDAGFDATALEQRYRRASIMAGVLPIGLPDAQSDPMTTLFWSIEPARYGAWRAAGLARWKDEVLALWPQTAPLLAAITDPDQFTLARYAHHTLAHPVAARLVAIGDAAHATSPQLGQGANMALLDAAALAAALADQPDLQTALDEYARRRRLHVRLYQMMSRLFTPLYQSHSTALPALRDALMSPVSRLPPMPSLLTALVSGTLGRPLAAIADPDCAPRT